MPNKLDLTNLFTYSVSYSLVINEQCLGELTQGKTWPSVNIYQR